MLLDKNNYFSLEAQCAYMGFSQFKGFVKELGGCEAKSMAELKGEWTDKGKAVFLVGSYLHAYNEGTLDKFKANNPEIYTSKKMLKADYIKADKAIEVISKDTLFMRALSGQKEVIVTAELFGIPWKIQVDSLFENEKRFTDLKYLRSLDGKEWNKELHLYEHILRAYGYYLQAAIYSKILSVSRDLPEGEYFEPLIAAVTKEDSPDKAIISFVSNQEPLSVFIDNNLFIVGSFIERVKAVKSGQVKPMRCEKCDYCRSNKKLTGTIHYSHFDNNY